MEFNSNTTASNPKNLYPCLATITITPAGHTDRSRRSSFGSNQGEEDNALRRVISGNRRKSSFGHEEKRAAPHVDESGKWYWRVQAGVNDNQLVLLPLTQPANPLLTSPPQPLSHAMPAHSTEASHDQSSIPGQTPGSHHHDGNGADHEGLGTKIKNLFRRGSGSHAAHTDTAPSGPVHPVGAGDTDNVSQVASTTTTAVDGNGVGGNTDRVLDQTAQGDMLPSANANRIGATNINANAESGWPGVINGQKLGSIAIDLRSIDKKVTLGGGKKGEGSWVIVQVNSQFGNMTHGMIDPIGTTHHGLPKSGSVRFDFDKDWIGAKAEAEILHHQITNALQNIPAHSDAAGGNHFPQSTTFQLRGGNVDMLTAGSGTAPNLPTTNTGLADGVVPNARAL